MILWPADLIEGWTRFGLRLRPADAVRSTLEDRSVLILSVLDGDCSVEKGLRVSSRLCTPNELSPMALVCARASEPRDDVRPLRVVCSISFSDFKKNDIGAELPGPATDKGLIAAFLAFEVPGSTPLWAFMMSVCYSIDWRARLAQRPRRYRHSSRLE